MRKLHILIAACGVLCGASMSFGGINVFLDFNANWITELDQAAGDAGVASFTTAERTQIQSNILSQLQTNYSGYQITFSTTDPGGTRDRLDFGVSETGNVGVLGFAPLQIGNYDTGDVISVLPRNFSFFIEGGDARATQITEISRGFSGTAAHELGHSLGLMHHQAYANPGITPANYANTGGLQNQHIMATGPTGITEAQREVPRTFNRWERAMFDITGGTIFGGDSIVNNPIIEVNEAGDAGGTIATATAISFSAGETSGYQLSLRRGDLDTSSDVDIYKFTAAQAGSFTAELFSTNLFAGSFNAMLRLYDIDGTTLLASNDDIRYSGNAFNSGTLQEVDPFLLNIPIAGLGTYYLQVSPVAGNAAGDDYELLVAMIPEPGSFVLLVGLLPFLMRRRRV